MSPPKLLARLRAGNTRNVGFADFIRLVQATGFRLRRTRGSHRIYSHVRATRALNLQPGGADAKPYQIRQFLDMLDEFGIDLPEGER